MDSTRRPSWLFFSNRREIQIWGKTHRDHEIVLNYISNQLGKILDLIFATNFTNIVVNEATATQLLDAKTIHHSAYIVELTYLSTGGKPIKKLNFAKINLKRSRQILNLHVHNTDNISDQNSFDQYTIINDINNIIYSLNIIQATCTSTKQLQHPSTSLHPWSHDSV